MIRSGSRTRSRCALIAAVASSLSASAAIAQFTPGDVYLASAFIPAPGQPCGVPTVLRFTPPTWQPITVGHPDGNFSGRIAYEPGRDALLIGYNDSHIETMTSAGVRTMLPFAGASNAQLFAPAGDGRIFFWGTQSTQIGWYDPANGLHVVQNATGTGPFIHTGLIGSMTYDAGTNSIFFSNNTAGDITKITKIPLTPSGTNVAGPVVTATFDASPGFNTEVGVGFSKGPNGNLFLALDDNGGSEVARMQLINPVTMATQPFATSNYNGVAAEVAGVYVPSINKAVVFDTFNGRLRSYSQGGQGEGTLLPPTNLSGGCFFGAPSQLIVIDSLPLCPADIGAAGGLPGRDGHLDNNDFIVFINWFFNSDARADRGAAGGLPGHDNAFDNNDFIVFINQFFAGC